MTAAKSLNQRMCSLLNSAGKGRITKLLLPMTDRVLLCRLVLQVERDRLAQTQLRRLLLSAGITLAGRQRDVRNLKARMARRSPK